MSNVKYPLPARRISDTTSAPALLIDASRTAKGKNIRERAQFSQRHQAYLVIISLRRKSATGASRYRNQKCQKDGSTPRSTIGDGNQGRCHSGRFRQLHTRRTPKHEPLLPAAECRHGILLLLRIVSISRERSAMQQSDHSPCTAQSHTDGERPRA